MKIYLIGSLRNPRVRDIAELLREEGHDVFDDWHACGPEADDIWRCYEIDRGRTYAEALDGEFANHAFDFDAQHLYACDAVVMVLPAGKSGHLELGFALGFGKRGYVLFDEGEPERWDLMYLFATALFFSTEDLIEGLK